nr:MAG TPA: hypothetical protein [Caudoviricetes sp.]
MLAEDAAAPTAQRPPQAFGGTGGASAPLQSEVGHR